jgi:hypothetical protein
MTRLIASPDNVGIDVDDIRVNPGTLIDIHEDVLRDLMTASAPRQRRAPSIGATAPESGNFHAPRRTCV